MNKKTNNTDTRTAHNISGVVNFPRLFRALYKQEQQRNKDRKKFINSFKNAENPIFAVLDTWQGRDAIPNKAKQRPEAWKTFTELKKYLFKRFDLHTAEIVQKHIEHLNTVAEAPDFKEAAISMVWKRSQMWGNNPRAEYKASGMNTEGRERYVYFDSGSIGGCGYDKGSTAVAKVLNMDNAILKLLYTIKNKPKNINRKNHEIFGYGSGYGILPQFEGGVGVSCYPSIFEKLGCNFRTTASGKSFDVYSIEKTSKKAAK